MGTAPAQSTTASGQSTAGLSTTAKAMPKSKPMPKSKKLRPMALASWADISRKHVLLIFVTPFN